MRRTVTLLALGLCVASALAWEGIMTTEERIRSHGYPVETHEIETSDGYLLTLFRLPYSHKLQNKDQYRPAILLQHGLLGNSDCFLATGPDYALAYILADAGYDVWLGNARGNTYSRKNSNISPMSSSFWNFGWHEIGIIDIPAMIDYIIATTGQAAIHYAGHSQGTTVYMVLMSERPEYNAKIKSAHLLAPCAFLGNGNSRAFRLFSTLLGLPGSLTTTLFENMELVPDNPIIRSLIDISCSTGDPQAQQLCRNMYLWFTADGYHNSNMTAVQVLIETHPASASTNQAIHYMHLHASGHFRKYDYGFWKNQRTYGRLTPPDYDLSKITAPTYLYSGQNDQVCAPVDVDKLVAEMAQVAEDYRIPDPRWSHLDFIVAYQMKEVLNDRVVSNCNQNENWN